MITLKPQVPSGTDTISRRLTVDRNGDVFTINGEDFDFTDLPNGGELPAEAITFDVIQGSVTRDTDGEMHLTLRVPLASGTSEEWRFPEPIPDSAQGRIVDYDGETSNA